MNSITDMFGSMVFSAAVMQQRLDPQLYAELQKTLAENRPLSPALAEGIAEAMKTWAMEKGATHFTHWFQPMTGVTAEKHDGFISAVGNGRAIMEFRGKELIQGEPDASSFPSGGLRATFEARGYTAWDPSSPAFIKEGVLCIPTAFCSYGGEALDKKTPLLRSMEALNRESLRLLRMFGHDEVHSVRPMAGAEQEYFLVDRALYNRRKDLIFTGRTLLGARPPKGQELNDHYFGTIPPRVTAFMKELNEELWKLGVPAKTEHNETAPAQHELAVIYDTVNIAADQNQLVMEMLRRVADRHGMVCLLHEKPFAAINGSGKHNNWSLCTDTGLNLLSPGNTPAQNALFLTMLCAVLQAVNRYQDLLRISVASAGNDHRLGANEAPPAILSVYLGEELTAVLDAIESGSEYQGGRTEQFKPGVDILPRFPRDGSDRNRTSPFAFTGNKFEFRMVGSNQSISDANIIINTAVADTLAEFCAQLEAAEDFDSALWSLLRRSLRENRRIIFNGNGYSGEWVTEAAARGLSNLRTTPDALNRMLTPQNIGLFTRTGVMSETELRARADIIREGYNKMVKIEAMTLYDMISREVLPAVSGFSGRLAATAAQKKALGVSFDYESTTAETLSTLLTSAAKEASALNLDIHALDFLPTAADISAACRDTILPRMERLRGLSDAMETVTDAEAWPLPTCGELLFSV